MANRYWVGGTGTWNGTNTANWSASSGGGTGASVPTSADNVFFDANSNTGTGAFTVTMATVAATCADFDASAVDGVMTLAGTVALDVYGSLSWPALSLFTRSFTGTTTFRATTTGKTVNTNGRAFGSTVTFDGVGGGWTLGSALTTSSAFILTNGSLDLGGFTATCFNFNSNNSNTRTLAFNGGTCVITGSASTSNQTLWNVATATGLTITGTPTVNVINNSTNSGFTRTFSNGITAGGSEAVAITLNIQLGDTGSLVSVSGSYLGLNFTGCSSTLNNTARTIYGNLIFSSGMSLTAGTSTTTFASTNATVRTITTNSNTLDFPITFNGVGGSWQLQDALTVGTSRAITLTNGSFDTNTKSLTCGTFNFSNANTKTLTLGTSTVTITGGTSTSGFLGSNTGTTYDVANSTIVFTTTGSVVFAGGSGTASGNLYGTITMSGLGGTLYLGTSTGSTTARCTTLNNTVSPCTITNSCTTAFTVTNFNVNGTAGNLVVLNSNTPGTARTISQATGTVTAQYLKIQDSTATGGATWIATPAINGGNNTGWVFSGPAVASRLLNTGTLLVNGSFDEVTNAGNTSFATRTDSTGTVYTTNSTTGFDEVSYSASGGTGQLGINGINTGNNIVSYSQQFNQTSKWNSANVTIAINVTPAPENSLTGTKLTEDSVASTRHVITQNIPVTAGALSNTYSASVFAKAGERGNIAIGLKEYTGFTNQATAFFNLSTGTVGSLTAANGASVPTGNITPVGNNWYQCAMSTNLGNATATAIGMEISVANSSSNNTYTGDGTSGLYIWGAQTQQAAAATVYVATGPTANVNLNNFARRDVTTGVEFVAGEFDEVTGAVTGAV